MIPYLLGYLVVLDQIDEVVDSINRRMDTFESLNLLAYGQGVVQERVQVTRLGTAAARATRARSTGCIHCGWSLVCCDVMVSLGISVCVGK